MAPSNSERETLAAANEFLTRYALDAAAGRTGGVGEYQRLWPAHADVIAREYAALQSESAPAGDRDVEAPEEATPHLLPCARIGRYRLQRELGHGGQGVVYLAEDEALHRLVAVKVLAARIGSSPATVARFRREATAAGRIQHPGICAVHDAGEHEGLPYLVMQYLEGPTLAHCIERAKDEGLAAPDRGMHLGAGHWRRVVRLIEQIGRAVHAAHSSGIIHRDLKPGNVVITASGQPVVLDFGLARELQGTGTVTATGDFLGTPSYAPPERVRGAERGSDARADVWALGAILFECLALERAFAAPTREALYRQILELEPCLPPAALRMVPRDLGIVIATALAKDPERRYQTALDLAEELDRVALGVPILARAVRASERLWRWSRRQPALAAALSVVVLLLCGGLATTSLLLSSRDAALSRARRQGLVAASAESLDEDPQRALLLARAAATGKPSPDVASALYAALALPQPAAMLPARDEGTLLTGAWPSPSGQHAVLAGWRGVCRLWTLDGIRRAVDLPHGLAHVWTARFSPDGRLLATVAGDGAVRIWDLAGRELARLEQPAPLGPLGQLGPRFLAAFAPGDSAQIAVGCGDGVVRLLSIPPGLTEAPADEPPRPLAVARAFDLQGGAIQHVTFASDGRALAAGTASGLVAVVDLDAGVADELRGHDAPVRQVAFSSDGAFLATGSEDGSVGLWTRGAAGWASRWLRPAHALGVASIAWAPDGRTFVSAGADQNARLWDVKGGDPRLLAGHVGDVVMACFSPDGTRVLTAGYDHTARLFDRHGRQLSVLRSHGNAVVTAAFVAGGRRALTAAWDGQAILWDLDPPEVGTLDGHGHAITCCVVGPDGSWCVAGSRIGEVWLWDLRHRRRLAELPQHGDVVSAVALANEGRYVVTCSYDHTVRAFDRHRGTIAWSERLGDMQLDGIAVDPAMDTVLIAGNRGLFVRRGGAVEPLLQQGHFVACALAPDGALAAVGASDCSVHLLNLSTGVSRVLSERHAGALASIAFAPDGAMFATTCYEGELRLWDREGRPLQRWRAHAARIGSVRFSPDGKCLATAGHDGTIALWLRSGGPLAMLRVPPSRVWSAEFTPDGHSLVTAGSDRLLRLWPAQPDRLSALADRYIVRGFSEAERQRYADLLEPR